VARCERGARLTLDFRCHTGHCDCEIGNQHDIEKVPLRQCAFFPVSVLPGRAFATGGRVPCKDARA